jgi:hypothetical protein
MDFYHLLLLLFYIEIFFYYHLHLLLFEFDLVDYYILFVEFVIDCLMY